VIVRTPIGTAAVVLALAAAGLAVGKAGTGDHHKFNLTYAAKDELKSTGLHLVSKRIDGALQPVNAVTRIDITLAAGTKTNVDVVNPLKQCPRAKVESRAAHPRPCDPSSEIGGGEATLSTGQEDVRIFATYDVDPQASGHQKGVFLFLTGRRQAIPAALPRGGRKLTIEVPRFCLPDYDPTDPTASQCSDGEAVLTELDVKLKRRTLNRGGGRKTILVRTPRKCPRSEKWKSKAVYSFRSGPDEKVKSSTSCRR
jgi:hypothetical protein